MSHSLIPAIPLSLIDGHPVASSNQVAKDFGKKHFHVLRDIENLDCSPEFNESNFGAITYTDDRGREKPACQMTRDGFVFLAMGYTGNKAAAFKEAYIAEFNRLEQGAGGHDAEAIARRVVEMLGVSLTPKGIDAARRLGDTVSPLSVSPGRGPHGGKTQVWAIPKVTDEERGRMQEMFREGYCFAEIRRRTGRSYKAVKRACGAGGAA